MRITIFSILFLIFSSAVLAQPSSSIPPAADSAEAVNPLLVGDKIPNHPVKSVEGTEVSLHDIVSVKPTILIFYRGGWCPYCNKQLAELKRIAPELRELGYQLVGISADRPSKLKNSLQKHDINYTLYSDNTMELARSFGIAFKVAPSTLQRYKNIGLNLAEASGHDHGLLPVPSVFLLDTDGVIQFQYVNPNYKVRLNSDVLLEAAKAYFPHKESPSGQSQ